MVSSSTVQVRAQSEEGWSTPVNLSNSGSTTNPTLVIDDTGVMHVFWVDKIDGYKYTNSSDGIKWTEPQTISVPFLTKKDLLNQNALIQPVMLAGPNGIIHILWKDNKGVLQYRQSTTANLGSPSSWSGTMTLADSIVKFDAVVDAKGVLHVSFINNIDSDKAPSGIYYRRLDANSWSEAKMIYPSKYYRSLAVTDDANVRLATTTLNDTVKVYIAWDDRPQRRIFLAKSQDGGQNWDESSQVRGPENYSGLELAYNINVDAAEDKVLLTWQAGTPGAQCVQYSQWSTDNGKQFGQPVKVMKDFAQCPQSGRFIHSTKDLSVVLFNTLGDLSLMAWDGTRWSKPLPQDEIASFINPGTLDNVIMGCQNVTSTNEKLYLVGCDIGVGGDIWFSSRQIGSTQDWFPDPSLWSIPEVLTSPAQKITSILSMADDKNNIHDIWVQNAPEGEKGAQIRYAKWDGQKWSEPATVISGAQINPSQLTLSMDSLGKLLLAWVDNSSGDMYFTWANSARARSASEWQTPVIIPSVSSANSSPDIVADSSGQMIVAFAVPINEDRGIYIVESNDFGVSWSQPRRVFGASAVKWQMVDHPHIALTGDGRLHILFERYTLWGDQRQSSGLYYIQSSDGGVSWSQPEEVSDQSILWSDLISYGKSDLHRIWQEDRGTSKVSIHQFSSDGGTNWSSSTTLSTLNNTTVVNHVSTDRLGNLYYLQLTGPEEPSVLDQRWGKSGWKIDSPRILDIDPKTWVSSSISFSVSSDGHLVASVLGDSTDIKSKWQSQIISLTESLESTGTAPTPYPALIAATPVVTATPMVMDVSGTPTPDSSLAGIDDSGTISSGTRNLVGLFLVGGVVAFFVLIFLFTIRYRGKTKTKAG